MHPFLAALTFLTKIPVPGPNKITTDNLVRGSAYYPLVGALLGGILWVFSYLLSFLFGHASLPAAALLLTLWVFLTGALHLDGLADTFDGLAGGATKEDRLRIMQDSSAGSFGVVAVALMLLLKFSILQQLQGERLLVALLYSPLLSRWSMVVLMYFTPYARKTASLGKPFVELIGKNQLALASALTLAAGFLYPLTFFLTLLLPVLLLTALLRWFFLQKIGGITGDCLGATNELLEIAVLFLLLLPRAY
ncbi:MAG: adenosylcobinamide-GDP ribazoletransferase [Firmicutes bacterium]|nr:adenosylcobinamide-GDP ribazoletransferase [Bacillota bacterium]